MQRTVFCNCKMYLIAVTVLILLFYSFFPCSHSSYFLIFFTPLSFSGARRLFFGVFSLDLDLLRLFAFNDSFHRVFTVITFALSRYFIPVAYFAPSLDIFVLFLVLSKYHRVFQPNRSNFQSPNKMNMQIVLSIFTYLI